MAGRPSGRSPEVAVFLREGDNIAALVRRAKLKGGGSRMARETGFNGLTCYRLLAVARSKHAHILLNRIAAERMSLPFAHSIARSGNDPPERQQRSQAPVGRRSAACGWIAAHCDELVRMTHEGRSVPRALAMTWAAEAGVTLGHFRSVIIPIAHAVNGAQLLRQVARRELSIQRARELARLPNPVAVMAAAWTMATVAQRDEFLELIGAYRLNQVVRLRAVKAA